MKKILDAMKTSPLRMVAVVATIAAALALCPTGRVGHCSKNNPELACSISLEPCNNPWNTPTKTNDKPNHI
jgi:hypothetical protein